MQGVPTSAWRAEMSTGKNPRLQQQELFASGHFRAPCRSGHRLQKKSRPGGRRNGVQNRPRMGPFWDPNQPQNATLKAVPGRTPGLVQKGTHSGPVLDPVSAPAGGGFFCSWCPLLRGAEICPLAKILGCNNRNFLPVDILARRAEVGTGCKKNSALGSARSK